MVDFVFGPLLVFKRGKLGTFRSFVGPMLLPFGAFGNPTLEQVLLLRAQFLAGLGWRHDFVGIGGMDPFDEGAFLWVAGNDGEVAGFGGLESVVFQIKAQFGFAFILVWPVAGEAVIGKDGADFAIEINRRSTQTERASAKNNECV